ncbi:ankyrin repeat domain-containing protein 12-like isoform X1 [Anopheles funestus]|uniref:ankyrin repeat domain-containing protein 12-like isoform X1 n=3 Tax=Anopheles funestus TaxID=62324 RepID=UPI0020C7034E|nr:ankyrin repeat domain-containing protein 12-like isoform X1 [Anopheles funestus]
MEPRSEPRTRRPPVGSPVKVKKKSAKHTVKFKDQCDVREDVLVVTVEPPSPSPGSPEPTPPKTAVTFALPPLTPARPKNATTGEQSVADTRALPRKVDAKVSQKVKPGEQRLSEGCTSLMYACQQGLTGDILKELRQKPSAVHRRDRSNKSALHYCSSAQDIAAAASVAMVAPELIESADEDGFTPLHLAVIQGNLQLVNLLLANGADVNALDNEGHSVVHWATVCGEVEALRAVLAAGADVSTPDINGGSPLHYAAQMCGANYEGKTARASAKLALEILNTLLNHPDTSVEVEDKDGRQPLLWAASAGSAKAVLALIKAGAHVESADKDGLTALHCAASRGHTECIDTLINLCGAHTDQIDSNGCTALHYAVTLGHADATSLLLKLDADPNRQDRKGRTPAHCGCAKGQMETVKILHTKKGNLWLRNAKGDLPVHDAASSGRRQLVQWLIQMKPKHINTTSNDGRTLLHIAAGHDNVDMCKLLLELGADINLLYRPSSKGAPLTPLDYALVKGYRSTAKYLQMQGGLPANKLRLSGRQQKILPDIDRVEPLKLTEKEELIDLKTSKRYIVYLNSNSESESQEDRTHRKSRHKRKGSHRGRRTSSCSDTVYLYRDGSNDISRSRSNAELHRSDQRSTKHRRTSSSSSASTTGSSSDSCCKHVRRKHKCYKKCNSKRSHSRDRHKDREREEPHDPKQQDAMKEYEFKYAEKKDAGPRKPGERCGKIILKQVHSGSSENDSPSNVGGRTGALKFSSERTARETHLGLPAGLQYGGAGTFDPSGGLGDFLDEPTSPRTPPRAEFNIRKESDTKSEGKSSDSSTTKKKKLKGTGKKTKLAKSTKKSDSPSEEEQAKPPSSTEVVTEAQVHQPPESMSKSTEDDGAATDATYTIEQRTRSDVEGLSETEDRAGKPRVTSKPVTETIEEVRDEHAVELVQQQTAATRVEVRKDRSKLKSAKSDSKSRSKSESSDKESAKVQQKPAVEEPVVPPAPPPSSPLVKEKTPEPVPEPPVPPKPEGIPVPEPQPEPQPVSLPQLETLPEVTEDRRESAVESQPLQGLEVDRGGGMGDDESLIAEESLPPLIEPEEPVQMETKPVPVPVEEEKPTPEESTESSPSKSSEETEPSSVVEEATEKPVPKTVDEPPAVVEEIPPVVEKPKPPEHPKERPKLRRSMESKMESVEEDTKMVAPVEPTKEGKDAAVPELLDQEKVDQTRGFFVSLDGTEDDEKKKKKIKKKPRLKEEEQQEQQSSKDQDSGFEPSPQAIRSKPSIFERPTHTATLPRRSAFTMVEERAVSSRPEGRKPGDKNAVNMTTVQQSIHRNIRRYYMERKIFQHLLELKSLQIRSTKVNESVLVKRAVDDYHKSTIELGYETGSTLKRYPYTEYSFRNFELFLYDTLKSLQKKETYNFQNISEVYDEAERRLSPDVSRYERALNCTTKTHRCLHATHAYTGIPCAAYIPMMNHHTIPKLGFGPYKSSTSGVGSFFLPKILTHPTDRSCTGGKVALELTHGNSKQVITLPSEKLDSNKRYYVTFTLNPDSNTDGDPHLSTGEPGRAAAATAPQQQQPSEQPSAADAQDNAQPQRRQQHQPQQQHHPSATERSPSVGSQPQSRALPTVEEHRSVGNPGGTPA